MVASKRGRGARNQAAKGKAAAAEEPQPAAAVIEPEVAEPEPEAQPDANNGDTEQMEQGDSAAPEAASAEEAGDEQPEGEQADAEAAQENAEAEPEKKEEEKVESGKILIENLPPSYLFDYQEKLKELFSQYGEIVGVKRGPIIVTELTTTPTLSAIVEFKNKESLDKALSEDGTVLDGCSITVAVESRAETAVLVGVPYEASTDYVKLLFSQCGEVAHIHEFSKTKYKILRVTFHAKECVEQALKLDRELRINGFLVTVSKYRDDDEQKAHNASANKNKRQHPGSQNRNPNPNANSNPSPNRAGAGAGFRGARGGAGFNARGNFRGDHYGARGRGGFGGARGGAFPRGGYAPVNTYMPPQGFMGRPGGFMDGQRPNKRLRQM